MVGESNTIAHDERARGSRARRRKIRAIGRGEAEGVSSESQESKQITTGPKRDYKKNERNKRRAPNPPTYEVARAKATSRHNQGGDNVRRLGSLRLLKVPSRKGRKKGGRKNTITLCT